MNKKAPLLTLKSSDRAKFLSQLFHKALWLPLLLFTVIAFLILILPLTTTNSFWSDLIDFILVIFPSSKTWSYHSPEFREKMIILYILYYLFFVILAITLIHSMIKNRKALFVNFIPLRVDGCERIVTLIVGGAGTTVLFVILSVTLIPSGSDSVIEVNQLDDSIRFFLFKDSVRWNSVWGVALYQAFSLWFIFYCILLIPQILYAPWWCLFKSKAKGE